MNSWERDFINRFGNEHLGPRPPGSIALSLKVRVTTGCYHREHSPQAYRAVDRKLPQIRNDGFVLEEHESGPEFLIYVAVTAAALGLADKLIGLVTTLIKARHNGIKKGDHPAGPLDVVLRGVLPSGEYKEKIIITIETGAKLDSSKVRNEIEALIDEWIVEEAKKNP